MAQKHICGQRRLLSNSSHPAIENGGDVKLSTLKRIADVLGVRVKDLFAD